MRKKLGSGKVTLRLQAKGNITGGDNSGQIKTWYKSKYYDLIIDFSNKTYLLKMVQDEGNFNGGTATMKSTPLIRKINQHPHSCNSYAFVPQ